MPWIWQGLPPSRLSFLLFSQFVCSYLNGAFTVEGTLQRVVDALVEAIERDGGEVITGVPVERIIVEDGRVVGLRLGGGATIGCDRAISNADVTHTFGELLSDGETPTTVHRQLQRMRPATSAFLLFSATSLDLAALKKIK